MSKPRKHHFIPETYQKQFWDGKTVCCADLERQSIFRTTPSGLGAKRDLNTVQLPSGEMDFSTIEGFYGGFEAAFPNAVAELECGTQTQSNLQAVTQFMLAQAMRAPQVRDLMSKGMLAIAPLSDDAMKTLNFTNHEIDLVKRARNGDEKAADQIGLQTTAHFANGAIKILKHLSYRVVRVEACRRFITGDSAVAYFGVLREKKKLKFSLPLPNTRTICVMPLNPSLLLLGDSKPVTPNLERQNNPIQTTNSQNLVKYVNRAIANNSNKQMLAYAAEDFPKHVLNYANTPSISALRHTYIHLAKQVNAINASF